MGFSRPRNPQSWRNLRNPRDFLGMAIFRGRGFFSWDGIFHQKATFDHDNTFFLISQFFVFHNRTYSLPNENIWRQQLADTNLPFPRKMSKNLSVRTSCRSEIKERNKALRFCNSKQNHVIKQIPLWSILVIFPQLSRLMIKSVLIFPISQYKRTKSKSSKHII